MITLYLLVMDLSMKMPMIITSSRLILIPVFILLFYLPFNWSHIVAAVIFAVAGITDWLDGYLARKLNQITDYRILKISLKIPMRY